jgi:cytochrome c553
MLCALGLLAFASSINAAEVDGDGKAKTRMCSGCHGIADYRTAYPETYAVPRLGGQDAGYIAKALRDYRSGARKHAVMQAMAASLNDKDITDIAAYYAGGATK